ADFLCNLVQPLRKKAGRIRTLFRICFSVLDNFFEAEKEISLFVFLTETGVGPCVADRARWRRLYKNCVGVAVREDFVDLEKISAGFALCPEPISRARVESRPSGRLCNLERF